jgi:hypothetical protein
LPTGDRGGVPNGESPGSRANDRPTTRDGGRLDQLHRSTRAHDLDGDLEILYGDRAQDLESDARGDEAIAAARRDEAVDRMREQAAHGAEVLLDGRPCATRVLGRPEPSLAERNEVSVSHFNRWGLAGEEGFEPSIP